MWLLALILSIKVGMPTWYWVLFTIISILKPIILNPIEHKFYEGFWKGINK